MIEEGVYYSDGKIRNTPVVIGETSWRPDIPIESVIKEELEDILSKDISDVDKSIEILLYVMKKQIFIDGNKRSVVIYCNYYLISKVKGIIVIPAELAKEFKVLLINYYEGKDEEIIKNFLRDKCFISI